jgi:peptide/nickel transport system permease protein
MSTVVVTARARPARVRGLLKDPLLTLSAGFCVVVVVLAVLAPVLAPYTPDQTDILNQSLGPSSAHLLGTDSLGRDILSRLLYGARLSLLGPAAVVVLATVLGTIVAISAVWIGGRYDRLVARALDVVFAFPSLLIAILAVAVFGLGLRGPIIALSIVYTPYIARVVRSVALRERNLPYVDACRMLGYSGWRICVRHILPNVRGIVAAQATVAFASALMELAAVSFLGLGVQFPTAEWGVMVGEGSSELLNGYAQQSLAAGGAIILTVVAFSVLGERLSTRSAVNTR